MDIKNFEFKAKVNSLKTYEEALLQLNPEFKGTDHQIDTYFDTKKGRLKLREGNIENALIQYYREDTQGTKLSEVTIYKHQPDTALKQILTTQLGVKIVVDKIRKIYFLDNVKFHFDRVKGLGEFVEVEAQSEDDKLDISTLKEQCEYFLEFFQIKAEDVMKKSYSDMMLDSSTDPL